MKHYTFLVSLVVIPFLGALVAGLSCERMQVYTVPPVPKIETPAWKQADIPAINADLHGITRMRQERENGPVSILALNPGEYAIHTHPRPREGWIKWDDVR